MAIFRSPSTNGKKQRRKCGGSLRPSGPGPIPGVKRREPGSGVRLAPIEASNSMATGVPPKRSPSSDGRKKAKKRTKPRQRASQQHHEVTSRRARPQADSSTNEDSEAPKPEPEDEDEGFFGSSSSANGEIVEGSKLRHLSSAGFYDKLRAQFGLSESEDLISDSAKQLTLETISMAVKEVCAEEEEKNAACLKKLNSTRPCLRLDSYHLHLASGLSASGSPRHNLR